MAHQNLLLRPRASPMGTAAWVWAYPTLSGSGSSLGSCTRWDLTDRPARSRRSLKLRGTARPERIDSQLAWTDARAALEVPSNARGSVLGPRERP